MNTLIICARADEVKLVERTFFPRHREEDRPTTMVIGAGTALVGCHFHRFIFMPGWDRDLSREKDASGQSHYNRIYDQIMNRRADKHTTTIIYL